MDYFYRTLLDTNQYLSKGLIPYFDILHFEKTKKTLAILIQHRQHQIIII